MSAASEKAAQNMRTGSGALGSSADTGALGSSTGRGLPRGDSLASTWNQSNFVFMQDEQTICMINQINGIEGDQVAVVYNVHEQVIIIHILKIKNP